ncbi:cytochrome b [Photobacterium makurazakiensis]|uniref:cytochrome b n=1 Tax=Photobacterium makurazakiensis TaxID=2910234 RepID=UPI003D0BA07F
MSTNLSKATILFHWVTGLMFLAVLGFGLYIGSLPRGPEKFELLGTHKSLGIVVLFIATARIFWRLKEGQISSLSKLKKWQELLSKVIHFSLLLATIAMPISGLMMNIGGDRATDVFGIVLIPATEKIEWLSSLGNFIHVQSINIIIAALALHILAALKHQFIDKDGSVTRILSLQ